MPTRKQKRRREKGKRHEYEYVYVDEEGNEVEVDADAAGAERAASRNGRAKPNPRAAQGRVQPPSWGRVGKRGLIFAPIMFITVMLTSSDASLLQQAITALWLMAIFLPFSYFMDAFMYKRYQKRLGAPPTTKR